MSWDNWPPFSKPAPPNPPRISSITNLWKWIIQLWLAAGERAVAITTLAPSPHSGPRWPKHNMVWERGVITAIDATSITIGGKTWDTTGTYSNPWNSTNPSSPAPPGSFDIVIQHCDPRRVIHVHVDAIAAPDRVTVPDLTHFVTERVIPTLGYCIGKTAFIIKGGGLWSSQRIPAWPNDNTLEAGTATLVAPNFIEDNTKHWSHGIYDGSDVMYMDTGGSLRRANINLSTDKRLWISTSPPGPAPGGDFFIVKREGLFQWGRISDEIFRWSRSVTESFITHLPDDTVGYAQKAKLTTPISGIFPDPVVFDVDLWTDPNEFLDIPDDPKNPNVTKTLRYLQAFIEAVCIYFVPPRASYDGVAIRPALFTFATLLAACGINAQSSTTGSHVESTGLSVALSNIPFQPIDVFYCIQDENGHTLKAGLGTWHDGILDGNFSDTIPDDPSRYLYEDRTIIVSLGWSRSPYRDFMRKYEQTVLIPDLDGSNLPVDPPTSDFPGRWQRVAPSTHYLDHTPLGFVGSSTLPLDLFAEGDLARWVGFNAHGPGIYGADQFVIRADSANAVLAPYYDHFYVGGHALQATAELLAAQLTGTATSGDTESLTDTSKDWYTNNWYPGGGGVLRTESGVGTSGSSAIHLFDVTKSGSGLWTALSGRWEDFIIEVETVIASGIWIKRPITGFTGSKILWDTALPATSLGKNYRIREPKWELNRFRTRPVKLTFPDGSVINSTVWWNDDNTLWFRSALTRPIEPGTTYAIDDPVPGGVWLRKGGAWTVPNPKTDTRNGVPLRPDMRDNLPHAVKRYGRFMIGDGNLMRVCQEIYTALNMLIQTFHEVGWTSRQDPAVPELNHRENFRAFGTTFANCEADYNSTWVWDEFDLLTPGDPSDNNPPGNPIEGPFGSPGRGGYPQACFFTNQTDFGWDSESPSNICRVYCYPILNIGDGDTCPIASISYFYVRAEAPNSPESPAPFDPAGWPNYQFDDNGDSVVEHQYKLMSVGGLDYPQGNGITERRGARVGNAGLPQPSEPIDPHSDPQMGRIDVYHGWEAVDQFAINDWKFKYRLELGELPSITFPPPGLTTPPESPDWWWWWGR